MLAKLIAYTGYVLGITLLVLAAWNYVSVYFETYIETIKLAL